MANKKLDKTYSNIIKDALGGKNSSKLEKEFYKAVTSEIESEIQRLPKTQQNKVKKEINKFDSNITQQLNQNIINDLSDGKYSSTEFKNQKTSIDKAVTKEQSELATDVNKLQNKGKIAVPEKSNNISLSDLMKSTWLLSEKRKDNTQVKSVSLVNMSHDYFKHILLIKLKVQSLSDNAKYYDVYYQFYEVEQQKTGLSVDSRIVKRPTTTSSGVSVSCTCEDYNFTFSNVNFKNKCHYGKLDSDFRPPPRERNPKSRSGLCRHLYSGMVYLKSKNIID